jgi:hypothetical protein
MNAAQAKRIPLDTFLARLGHAPVRERVGESWYRSPLRDEQEASFRVSQGYNNWVDWGTGERGDIINLAERLFHQDTAGALREITRVMGDTPATWGPPGPAIGTSIAADHIEVRPIRSFALLQYLRERGIELPTARKYLNEIHYTVKSQTYYALGFPSDSGGYELRNKYFKGTHGHKDVTLLDLGKPGIEVAVFEGFMDFLSALQLDALPETTKHALVMNSTRLRDRALERIGELAPMAVYLFLDHDPSGVRLTEEFKAALSCTVVDASILYAQHKDVNAMLMDWQRWNAARGKPQEIK